MKDNIRAWVSKKVDELQPQGPCLEVGSYDENGSVRDLFPEPYTGMDIREGKGVDVVKDVLTDDLRFLYRTIVCCETLEHVTKPWLAVERMARWLEPGGYLFVTAPFQHFIHDYPGDYWRFTDQGFRVLFEEAGLQTVCTDLDMTTAFGVAQR